MLVSVNWCVHVRHLGHFCLLIPLSQLFYLAKSWSDVPYPLENTSAFAPTWVLMFQHSETLAALRSPHFELWVGASVCSVVTHGMAWLLSLF